VNPLHKGGAAKARLLLSLGYQRDAFEALESDLRMQHLPLDPVAHVSERIRRRLRNRRTDLEVSRQVEGRAGAAEGFTDVGRRPHP
jgi:hypothetical protein